MTNFLLDFTKYRRRRLLQQEPIVDQATMSVLYHALYVLVQTGAPILPFTCQEVYDAMLSSERRPPTVFQMPIWHQQLMV